jgi:hypothetical protein
MRCAEVGQMILAGIDRPHDVAHRVDELAGQPRDGGERVDQRGVGLADLPLDHFAEERNPRQARADVVVQVGGDALADAFELRQPLLAAPSQRLLGALALGHVAGDAGEEPAVVPGELAEGDLQRNLVPALVPSLHGDRLPGDVPLAGALVAREARLVAGRRKEAGMSIVSSAPNNSSRR